MSEDVTKTVNGFVELLGKIVKMLTEFMDAFLGNVQFGNAANVSENTTND